MNHGEFLIAQAMPYWSDGMSLPIDLFAKMQSEGLDVVALERRHINHE